MATKFSLSAFLPLALLCSFAASDTRAGVRDGIATAPPMGFNSYYMNGPSINESLQRIQLGGAPESYRTPLLSPGEVTEMTT